MKERAIGVAKGAAIGFALVFGAFIGIAGTVEMLAALANLHSVSVNAGPVPLMSAYSGPSGSGSQTEWGVGALAYVGAVVGAVLAWRGERARA